MKKIIEIEENGTLKPEILAALKSVLAAKAFMLTLKPISEGVYSEAFEIYKPVVEHQEYFDEHKDLLAEVGKAITSSEELYNTDDVTFKKISDFHKQKLAEKGFDAEGECCPMLCAEQLFKEAKRLLIDVMSISTQITNEMLTLIEDREKYLELIMRMLVTYATDKKINLNLIKEI
jgi:hypothetical protein